MRLLALGTAILSMTCGRDYSGLGVSAVVGGTQIISEIAVFNHIASVYNRILPLGIAKSRKFIIKIQTV